MALPSTRLGRKRAPRERFCFVIASESEAIQDGLRKNALNNASPRRGEAVRALPAVRMGRKRESELKTDAVPVTRPAGRYGKTRAQTRRGNNRVHRHCRKTDAGRLHSRPPNKCPPSRVCIVWGVDKPKKCISSCLHVSARKRFRAFGVQHGFREDELFLLHCGWGLLQEFIHARNRHVDIGTVCLLFVCSLAGARTNRHQHRCRATAVTGLRSAADSVTRLYVDAWLLGLG